MPKKILYAAVVAILLASCKKNNDSGYTTKPTGKTGYYTFSINHADYQTIVDVMKKQSLGLKDIIAQIKQNSSQSNTLNNSSISKLRTFDTDDDLNQDYDDQVSGEDQMQNDQPDGTTFNSIYLDANALGGNPKVTTFNMRGFFRKRGITMQITTPFYYLIDGPYGNNHAVFGSSTNIEGNLLKIQFQGDYLGTFDPASKYQVFNINDDCKCMSNVTGNSSGGIVESRTYSKSLTGEASFTYGGEGLGGTLKGGATISSQLQSTTLYDYTANFQIQNDGSGYPPHVTYTLAATSFGVQHN